MTDIKTRRKSAIQRQLVVHGWECQWVSGEPTHEFSSWINGGRTVLLHRDENGVDRLLYQGDEQGDVDAIVAEANAFAETGE